MKTSRNVFNENIWFDFGKRNKTEQTFRLYSEDKAEKPQPYLGIEKKHENFKKASFYNSSYLADVTKPPSADLIY